MARETKVGLLAGLAFIICFAIILTNRGRDSAVAPPRPVLTDSGGQIPQRLQQTASRTPTHPAPIAPTSGAELALSDPTGRVPMPGNVIPSTALPADLTERNLTSRTAEPAASLLPQTMLIPTPTNNPIPEPTSAGTKHTVAAGETLSKIALAHFGSKSRALVDSIYAANKNVMQSPDNLKVGMVLVIPDVSPPASKGDPKTSSSPTRGDATALVPTRGDAVVPSFTKGDATSPKSTGKATDDSKGAQAKAPSDTGRFYQVKKNDRWVSIARDQLGDAGRWKELHELNKDKFPDPSKIREGVRIKLPVGKSLASLEGRR